MVGFAAGEWEDKGMPQVDETAYLAEGAVVTGDVTVGACCSVWHNAVIRGDDAPITLGERTNVQDCAVLHADEGRPLSIGSGVTIGHGAIVHGTSVGDDTLIGMGAIVLGGARVGSGCIVGAGALVTQGTAIPDGTVAFGSPARVVRPMTEGDLAANRRAAAAYARKAREARE